MDIQEELKQAIQQAIIALYQQEIGALGLTEIALQPTKKEFAGLYTFVTFPLTKSLRQAPAQIGQAIGGWLRENSDLISAFNVVQGFLNLSIADVAWVNVLNNITANSSYGTWPAKRQTDKSESVMVEFSSPNTNKPLHLGHLRNIFLGDSVSRILKANGYDVAKTCIVNDRGCISANPCGRINCLEKDESGQWETPESSGMKGDHLVGKYYVLFDKELRQQLRPILEAIYDKEDLSLFDENQKIQLEQYLQDFNRLEIHLKDEINKLDHYAIADLGTQAEIAVETAMNGNRKWKDVLKVFDDEDQKTKERKQKELQKILKPILVDEDKIDEVKTEIKDIAQTKTAAMQEVQQMLRQWEQGDPEIVALWSQLNAWVYTGFDETYKSIGVSFDKTYYESNTYVLGKEVVEEGLQKGVFYRKDDNSVWIDLAEEGLDQKLVLRSDGTSVYITQDLGTTDLKFQDFHNDRQIWVVGNEQDYHFNVLFAILRRLGRPYAKNLYHLSYGMVDLPTGKMKSREGTVVDADDLIGETVETAATAADEAAKGKLDEFNEAEKKALFHMLGLGALKYYLLKVDPQKRMQFNPAESVDLHGNTGPYIQYVHARIQSILRKATEMNIVLDGLKATGQLDEMEQQLIFVLSQYPQRVAEAGTDYAPSYIAQYAYELAKTFNQFYDKLPVLKETDTETLQTRLALTKVVGETIRKAMGLLSIEVPDKM